eukprot:1624613-Lingulodinium_polyedra.AAC.1
MASAKLPTLWICSPGLRAWPALPGSGRSPWGAGRRGPLLRCWGRSSRGPPGQAGGSLLPPFWWPRQPGGCG